MSTTPSAKIIADSLNPFTGDRVTTMEVVIHRFVLAEFNTHRVFSRNSASSRAIPVSKQLARVVEDPAWPVSWPCEQPGMQGGDELEGLDLDSAQGLFLDAHRAVVGVIQDYLIPLAQQYPDLEERKAHTLHKSLINRLIEPWMWHPIVVTSTEWENFFHQRATRFSPLAQPEIRATADAMLDALEASTPVVLSAERALSMDGWHLPYVTTDEHGEIEDFAGETSADPLFVACAASTARCARVATLNHDGVRSLVSDMKLFKTLVTASPMHASPLEHPCFPALDSDPFHLGNLDGFHQLRHTLGPSGFGAGALR